MVSAEREALAQRVLAFSNADETEVGIYSSDSALSRFTHNTIHQNVDKADLVISVRAIVGKRTGVARTNDSGDASLREVVRRAIALAKLAPEDPLLPRFPSGGVAVSPQGAFSAETALTSPERRARMCEDIFETAERENYWCAGFVTTSSGGVTVVNSNGACGSFDGTDAGVNVKMNGEDSSGFAEAYSTDVAAIDARAAGKLAAQKTRDSSKPAAVAPGDWTVIMEPAAFGELLMYLADHFSAQAFDEGSSFLTGALDTKVLGDNVTIGDDYANALNPGMPFDYEGQPTKRLALIENGIGKAFVTDSYYANKLGRENTGHALPAPNASGPHAQHIVVSPGTKPLTQLIAETARGLLVTRFWYIRTVDRKQAIVTGMTRDGTFLIEDGKIAGGVKNMRFNHSVIEALRHCEFANELVRTGGYSYSAVVPAAKIEGFSFSSGTAF